MRVLALAALLVLAGCQERFAPNPTQGEMLAHGMKSHYLRRNLVSAWSKDGRPVEVILDETIQPVGASPPVTIHAVRIGEVAEGGNRSRELVLVFIDDGLMEVCAYPVDFDAFVAAGKATRDPTASKLVDVRTATDRRGQRYVSWSDSRLVAKAGGKRDACD